MAERLWGEAGREVWLGVLMRFAVSGRSGDRLETCRTKGRGRRRLYTGLRGESFAAPSKSVQPVLPGRNDSRHRPRAAALDGFEERVVLCVQLGEPDAYDESSCRCAIRP